MVNASQILYTTTEAEKKRNTMQQKALAIMKFHLHTSWLASN